MTNVGVCGGARARRAAAVVMSSSRGTFRVQRTMELAVDRRIQVH
jgi:hypothetical protein